MTSKICECCGQILPEQWELVAFRARLSRKQTDLFLAVATGRGHPVRWNVLADALYGGDVDGGPLNIRNTIFVTAAHANARLKSKGYKLEGVHGLGLRLATLPRQG